MTPAPSLLELLLHGEEATHTSRAALRPGTAAAVKISAGLDCVAVSPLGSDAWVSESQST